MYITERDFFYFISRGHAASQLENIHQELEENLRTFIYRYSKIHQAATRKDPVITQILPDFLDSLHISVIQQLLIRFIKEQHSQQVCKNALN